MISDAPFTLLFPDPNTSVVTYLFFRSLLYGRHGETVTVSISHLVIFVPPVAWQAINSVQHLAHFFPIFILLPSFSFFFSHYLPSHFCLDSFGSIDLLDDHAERMNELSRNELAPRFILAVSLHTRHLLGTEISRGGTSYSEFHSGPVHTHPQPD